MAKRFLSSEKSKREWLAGMAFAYIRGRSSLSKTCNTLKREDPKELLGVLRENKEVFSRVNEHAFWELVSALGLGEP